MREPLNNMRKKFNLDDPLATFETRYAIAKGELACHIEGKSKGEWVLSIEGDLVSHVSFHQIALKFKTEDEARAYLHRNGVYSGYSIFRVLVQTGGYLDLSTRDER